MGVRRVDAPEPRTRTTVVELARLAAMTAFDHARPLWEFTLVDHLEGGEATLVMKPHHSLTDGAGEREMPSHEGFRELLVSRQVLEYLPFVPIAHGARVGVAVVSYNGRAAFGLTGELDTAPDLAVLADAIEEGVGELTKLA